MVSRKKDKIEYPRKGWGASFTSARVFLGTHTCCTLGLGEVTEVRAVEASAAYRSLLLLSWATGCTSWAGDPKERKEPNHSKREVPLILREPLRLPVASSQCLGGCRVAVTPAGRLEPILKNDGAAMLEPGRGDKPQACLCPHPFPIFVVQATFLGLNAQTRQQLLFFFLSFVFLMGLTRGIWRSPS